MTAATAARRVTHPKTGWNVIKAGSLGLWRFLKWFRSWIKAEDKKHLIADNATSKDKQKHEAVCDRRIVTSWVIFGSTMLFLAIGYFIVGFVLPVLFALAIMVALSAAGRTAPLVVPAEVVSNKVDINESNIQKVVAGATTGLKVIDAPRVKVLGQGVTWDRDHVWWSARVEVPDTVPADNVLKAQKAIRSGLGIGANQLIMKVDPENDGIVDMAGCVKDPWDRPPRRSPLLDAERLSVWEPLVVGANKQGSPITLMLLFTGFLVGAIPRIGKTYVARLLALAVALDPYADLYVYDLKGGADWRMFKNIALSCAFGRSNAVMAKMLDDLLGIQKEIDRRSELIGELGEEVFPEGQLTYEAAHNPKYNLHPIFIFIDEVQWAFVSIYSKKIIEVIEGIVKSGQFVGVQVILATQRPDSESMPTKIRDVLATRIALKCMTRQSSETVLGTQAYQEGWDAAALPPRKGLTIMYGVDDTSSVHEPMYVQTDKIDLPEAKAICDRAERVRESLSRLPGQREPEPTETYEGATEREASLLDLARQAAAGRPYVPSRELFGWLNANSEWTGRSFGKFTELAEAMRKECGIDVGPVRENGNRSGYRLPVDNS